MKLLITGLFLHLFVGLFGQATITGKVTDKSNNEVLIGASVFIKGTTKQVVTNIDGFYTITDIKDSCMLEFFYIGYETQTKQVIFKNGNTIDVKMKVGKMLEDVVVVGYGTVKKTDTKGKDKGAIRKEKTAKPLPAAEYAAPKATSAGDVPIKGKRKEGTVYMTDGIRVVPSAGLPPADTAPEPPPPAAEPTKLEVDEVFDMPSRTEKKEEKSKAAATTHKTLLDAALDIRAGRVTASENSDFKHWDFWNDKTKNEGVEEHQKTWGFQQFERHPIVVTNQAGYPLANVALSLKSKGGTTFWECRTDNLGRAEAWLGMFDIQKGEVFIELDYQGLTRSVKPRKTDLRGTHIRLETTCKAVKKSDICFIVDATSSMSDEINYLKQDLADVVNRIKTANPAVAIRLSSVFYRDKGDDYLVKPSDFTSDLSVMQSFLSTQGAGGGGDIPEAVDAALGATLDLKWDDEADAKIAFLLLDAPPHEDAATVKLIQQYTQAYAKKGIKIIPISASGIDKSTEYLMRFLALATNGTYTYLTDDSGVGESHIDATVSDVSIEFLNNLLVRIINQNLVSSACAEKAIATLQRVENQQSNEKISLDAKLFPVPAMETLTLELSDNVGDVTVFSLDGKAVLSLGKRDKGQHIIDISKLASATYFMQIIKDGVMFGQKFVVLGGL